MFYQKLCCNSESYRWFIPNKSCLSVSLRFIRQFYQDEIRFKVLGKFDYIKAINFSSSITNPSIFWSQKPTPFYATVRLERKPIISSTALNNSEPFPSKPSLCKQKGVLAQPKTNKSLNLLHLPQFLKEIICLSYMLGCFQNSKIQSIFQSIAKTQHMKRLCMSYFLKKRPIC